MMQHSHYKTFEDKNPRTNPLLNVYSPSELASFRWLDAHLEVAQDLTRFVALKQREFDNLVVWRDLHGIATQGTRADLDKREALEEAAATAAEIRRGLEIVTSNLLGAFVLFLAAKSRPDDLAWQNDAAEIGETLGELFMTAAEGHNAGSSAEALEYRPGGPRTGYSPEKEDRIKHPDPPGKVHAEPKVESVLGSATFNKNEGEGAEAESRPESEAGPTRRELEPEDRDFPGQPDDDGTPDDWRGDEPPGRFEPSQDSVEPSQDVPSIDVPRDFVEPASSVLVDPSPSVVDPSPPEPPQPSAAMPEPSPDRGALQAADAVSTPNDQNMTPANANQTDSFGRDVHVDAPSPDAGSGPQVTPVLDPGLQSPPGASVPTAESWGIASAAQPDAFSGQFQGEQVTPATPWADAFQSIGPPGTMPGVTPPTWLGLIFGHQGLISIPSGGVDPGLPGPAGPGAEAGGVDAGVHDAGLGAGGHDAGVGVVGAGGHDAAVVDAGVVLDPGAGLGAAGPGAEAGGA
jgi:hypothetical protein